VRRLGGAATVCVVAAVTLAGCAEQQGPTGDGHAAITTACEQAVEGKLESPSTAKFHVDTSNASDSERGWWTVSGHVDSHRLDASAVRTEFVCDVTWLPDTRVATVTNVTVSED
jgi:hypothetical protein